MVRVTVNGEPREVEAGTSVARLVELLALAPERLAVELNREVLRRARWAETELAEGDRVEIVHFVGGGSVSDETRGWTGLTGLTGKGKTGDLARPSLFCLFVNPVNPVYLPSDFRNPRTCGTYNINGLRPAPARP
jgi:thiamine biosynthesis protein ThiS